MKKYMPSVWRILCIILVVLGIAVTVLCLYFAGQSHGIVQSLGVLLLDGDLVEPDGFIWGRGGMEGITYAFARVFAMGFLAGLLCFGVGAGGLFRQRRRRNAQEYASLDTEDN